MARYPYPLARSTTPYRTPGRAIPAWRRMVLILASITVIISLLLAIRPRPAARITSDAEPVAAGSASSTALSAGFAPTVEYWAPQIAGWAQEFGLDPNLVATIMQVESCGDPAAVSAAGAQGLFQVMPFHFQPGEDSLDPDTNARRGLAYFVERLQQTGGDVGRALAGYNGGHGAAASSWDDWLPETQRYYIWTTGIYEDIQQGNTESATLQRWRQSGGGGLCQQAAQRLGLN